jgi:hypothetical protein
MNSWLRGIVTQVESAAPGTVIVLDADGILEPTQLAGEVRVVEDWWSLRRCYELSCRRASEGRRVTLLARRMLAEEPLPWDIERSAAAVVLARLPGPENVRAVLSELVGGEAESAMAAVKRAADPVAALIGTVTGLTLGVGLSRCDQLRLAGRVALRSDLPREFAELAGRWVSESTLQGLLHDPPDPSALQLEWARFADGAESAWAACFESMHLELGQLFLSGLLKPVRAGVALSKWAAPGLRDSTTEERVEALLEAQPQSPPPTLSAWQAVALWWAEVRALVAKGPEPIRERAWKTWVELDWQFHAWLRESYGFVLSSSAQWPSAVHRIAPFLSRRLRDRTTDRVMLIVLDGLGLTQWSHLVKQLRLEPLHIGTVCALVPTYTTISRQAIFAGDLPASYADSLWSTHRERQHWRRFWSADGLPESAIAFHHVKGRLPFDRIEIGEERAIGVVVNALDDLMHTSELFGDAQLLANIDVWAENGFLRDLVTRAAEAGVETWITADHGNLECLPAGNVKRDWPHRAHLTWPHQRRRSDRSASS